MDITGKDRMPEPQDREDALDDEQHEAHTAIAEQMVQFFFQCRKKLPNGHPDQFDYNFVGKFVADPKKWTNEEYINHFVNIFKERHVGPGKMFNGDIDEDHWQGMFMLATLMLQYKMETPIFRLAIQAEGYWFTYTSLKAGVLNMNK
jgi:hypothetical protein